MSEFDQFFHSMLSKLNEEMVVTTVFENPNISNGINGDPGYAPNDTRNPFVKRRKRRRSKINRRTL